MVDVDADERAIGLGCHTNAECVVGAPGTWDSYPPILLKDLWITHKE